MSRCFELDDQTVAYQVEDSSSSSQSNTITYSKVNMAKTELQDQGGSSDLPEVAAGVKFNPSEQEISGHIMETKALSDACNHCSVPDTEEISKCSASNYLTGTPKQKNLLDCIRDQSKKISRSEEELVQTKALEKLMYRDKDIMMEDHYGDSLIVKDPEQDYEEFKQGGLGEIFSRLGEDLTMLFLIRCSRSDYNMISMVNKKFMSIIRSNELYRQRHCMGIVEPWIYFLDDVHQWKAYDPNLRRFIYLPPRRGSMDLLSLPSIEKSFVVGCLAVGTELMVFSVKKVFKIIDRYNVISNMWQREMSSINTPRRLFGAASKREIAIFVGGRDSRHAILSSAELYNSEFGTWTQLPNMKRARVNCSCVFIGRMFYAIGGIGENNESLTSGEVYDVDKKTWSEIPDMWPSRINGPDRSRSPPFVAVVNDQLYALDLVRKEVLIYDIGNNIWSSIGKFPKQTKLVSSENISFKGCGNRLCLISLKTKGCYGFELNSCVPFQGQLQWELLARMNTVNCAVMEC